MPEPLLRQLSSFTLFLLGGVVLGFALDLLRAFRLALRPRGAASFLLDLSYWAAAFAVVLPLLVLGTWGELRLFVWLGLGLGAGYYLLFLRGLGFGLARRVAASFLAVLGSAGGIPAAARSLRKELRASPRRRRPPKVPAGPPRR
ncbi:MAG: spore cortex biosynthesis protein YabQ [Firmicutes bacterium]|nr:spore cortex biosynthesis protein YabQ [Bacillota bacterium]